MQTFLPYPDFKESVEALDNRRLGKQRVEAMQIMQVLDGKTDGWKNHPAVRMWAGYRDALGIYMNHCINEWKRRGFENSMKLHEAPVGFEMPHWLGDEWFHASHRSNLLSKLPDWYGRFGWEEQPGFPYIWPE